MRRRGPILVPEREHRVALDQLSKNALIDLVWSLAGQCVDNADDPVLVWAKLREEVPIVVGEHRGDRVPRALRGEGS